MAYTEGTGDTMARYAREFRWNPLIVDAAATETSPGQDVTGADVTTLVFTGTRTSNQCVYTVDISPDNSNWHTCDWMYSSAGTDGPVASITLSATGTKVVLIPHAAAYIRVKATVTAVGTYSAILMAK